MDPRSSLWDNGRDEEVQVNQRALIDKVLARYSGEHTVLRELLQNSDDAGAKTVEIRFNTKAYLERHKDKEVAGDALQVPSSSSKLPDLTKELLHQWEFRNDGIPFREEDWSRLKKIAEGNPDEEKIGAFGVGFYSLFSVTDEPFVTSGGEWMGFYWKDNKDQLFARRGPLPPPSPKPEDSPKWTVFTMPLREASTFPARPVDIARFLATSLTFMRNLRDVSMYFNEHQLVRVTKSAGMPKKLNMSSTNLDTKTKIQGMMVVREIESSDLRMQAKVLRWVYSTGSEKPKPVVRDPVPASKSGGGFFASLLSSFSSSTPVTTLTPLPTEPPPLPVDPLEAVDSSVLLTVYNAKVETKLDKKMLLELERATKKKPPAICWYSLIYTGKDEYDMSKEEDDKEFKATGSVFQGLRADLDGSGTARVFIGHATSQSTGIGGHISARFIPTVERESIDLVDRQVSVWNKELLWVGGYLCRFIYETQLGSVRMFWDEALKSNSDGSLDIPEGTRTWLEGKGLHALKFFTFHPTTPSAVVGINMEAAFFGCAKDRNAFPMVSTAGVKSANQVRTYSAEFRTFLKTTPMLPEVVAKGAPEMVRILKERGMVRDITFADVISELSQRPLSEQEMLDCLKWRMSLDTAEVQSVDNELRRQFLQAAVVSIVEKKEDGSLGEERIIPLSSIKTFLSTTNPIPPSCPLPPHTLPFSLSKNFKADNLKRYFGWTDLAVNEWLEYLLAPSTLSSLPEESNALTNPVFAEHVLHILAKSWGGLSKFQLNRVVEILQDKPIIPTKMGMRIPKESYFQNANVFPDLPIVQLPKGGAVKGSLEKLLVALGVMKHVELQIVFNRMINTGDWGVHDLMKYLVAVRSSLTSLEMDRLRKTAAFPQESAKGAESRDPIRKIPGDLYEPIDVLRDLGLPILDWGKENKWKPTSDEARLLFDFGLKRFPPVATLLRLASGQDITVRRKALQYFLDNFNTRYMGLYQPEDYLHLPFVPALKADGTSFMATPGEVFIDPDCALLGFSLVEPSLRNDALVKLKLAKDPPTTLIMPILSKTPPTEPDLARRYFEYLAGRIADFTPDQWTQLRNWPIIPATPPGSDVKSPEKWTMAKPGECFFRNDRAQNNANVHSKLFTFVDFGNKANNFLRACGVKNEPNMQEIAELVVKDPRRFLALAGGQTGYLDELRQMAAYGAFSQQLVMQMKRTPFLLASKRTLKSAKASKSSRLDNDLEDEDYETVFDLLRPDQIIIVDDQNAYSLFCDSLYAAPQEDLIEAFYASLGVRRIAALVADEYRPVQVDMSESSEAKRIKALVIERFPLLLHEKNASSRVKADWLGTGNNFVVRMCAKLNKIRTLEFGGKRLVKSQDASAAANLASSYTGLGPLMLYVSKVDNDYYEIAHAICRVLLKNNRNNDTLLFTTLLSTDLRSLRRRGYNVDRILNQQRAERELLLAKQAAAEREAREQLPMPPGGDPFAEPPPPPVPKRPALPAPDSDTASVTSTVGKEKDARDNFEPVKIAKSPATQMINTFKNRFNKISGSTQDGALLPPAMSSGSSIARTPSPMGGVTPTSDIEKNIRTAIDACRAERSSVLNNRQHMTKVKESLEDGYCDISGSNVDMELIGTVEGYKFYVAKDIPNPQQVAISKQASLARFAGAVINPLKEVYRLPPTSLHVFYDLKGGVIAFNRNGGIFLNLRYYESWHDEEVQQGSPAKALISWYHSLAHEIAHNLVQPHNAEHEFYFSALCESHLVGFTKILNAVLR